MCTLDNACGVIASLHATCNNLGPGKMELQAGPSPLTYLLSISPEDFITVQEQCKFVAAQGESAAAATQSDVKCPFGALVMISAGTLAEMDGTEQGSNIVAEECSDLLRSAVAGIHRRLSTVEIGESLSRMSPLISVGQVLQRREVPVHRKGLSRDLRQVALCVSRGGAVGFKT